MLTYILSVVFSYWTYTLDLIEALLKQASISYTRIDGQHSGDRREEAIQKFQTDDTIQVILVSITCGGAGYVLTPEMITQLSVGTHFKWMFLIGCQA